MEDIPLTAFGEQLKAFRQHRNITQTMLASSIGVHRNTIGIWERGSFLPESKTIVLELARQLHLNKDDTRRLLEASLTGLTPYWSVPFSRNPFFTGREDVLTSLHRAFCSQQHTSQVPSYVLNGLGGVGKTQTVLEYAYRYQHDYAAVFWVAAETEATLLTSITSIANTLRLILPDKQDSQQLILAVRQWLTFHKEWLLIFDNVEDLKVVKLLLPSARQGTILFTSQLCAFDTLAQTLTLLPFSPDEGVNLLLRRAHFHALIQGPVPLSEAETAVARTITKMMEGLPLAIDQAGAYIQATGCSLTAFLASLHTDTLHLLQQREETAEHPHSVVATVTLAFQKLQKQDPLAAQLLTFCAFLSPDSIPESLLLIWVNQQHEDTCLPSQQRLQAMLKAIRAYSFLNCAAQNGTFTIHRLVQLILLSHIEQNHLRDWIEYIIFIVNQSFPEMSDVKEVAIWPLCQQLLPHAEICTVYLDQWNICTLEARQLLQKLGVYYREHAQYAKAEQYLCKARDLFMHTQGSKDPALADTLLHLAVLYLHQGKYKQVEPILQHILSFQRDIGQLDHPLTADTFHMLGQLATREGRFEVAEQHLICALAIKENWIGNEQIELVGILDTLAELYWKQHRYDIAATFFYRSLSINTQYLGSQHPYVADSLNNLALIYRDQNNYAEAENLFQQALTLYEHLVGLEHPYVATILKNLGVLYIRQERYSDAELLLQRALTIREQVFGLEHPFTAGSLYHLAMLFSAQAHYRQAKHLLYRALVIQEKILGKDHPDTIETTEQYLQMQQHLV